MNSNKKSVLASLTPLIWASKLYGCLPLSFQESGTEPVQVKVYLFGIIHGMILILISGIYRIIMNVFFKGHFSDQVVFKSSALLGGVATLISYFSYFKRLKDIQSISEKNLEFSKLIKNEKFYKKAFWLTFGEILLAEFLSLAYYLSFYITYPDYIPWVEMIMEHYLRFVITLFRFQFSNSLLLIFFVFKMANEEFEEMFKSKRMLIDINTKKTEAKLEDVSNLVKLYSRACDICGVLNTCFGPTLAVASICMMLQVVLCCYVLVIKDITFVIFLFWFCSYVIEEWFCLRCCEKVVRETKRTGVLVHNLMAQTKDPRLKEQLQQFSLQLLHRKVKFTACGLFPLNYTLIYSIAGAVTTYLVILIQFQAASNETKAAAGTCATPKVE